MNAKWHKQFLENALMLASWSKYPGHKVGCVIVDDDKTQLSAGFNGFPRGVKDDYRLQEREIAIQIVVHAEANAIAAAARNGHSVKGGIMYSTHRPCPQCASLIIQAGIRAVYTIHGQKELSRSGVDWGPVFQIGEDLLREAGVGVHQVHADSGVEHSDYAETGRGMPCSGCVGHAFGSCRTALFGNLCAECEDYKAEMSEE